jgi:putative transposase
LVKDWRTYLDERIETGDDIHKIKSSTKTGRPVGSDDFVKKIEKLTGRLLQRKRPGPKKKQKY